MPSIHPDFLVGGTHCGEKHYGACDYCIWNYYVLVSSVHDYVRVPNKACRALYTTSCLNGFAWMIYACIPWTSDVYFAISNGIGTTLAILLLVVACVLRGNLGKKLCDIWYFFACT